MFVAALGCTLLVSCSRMPSASQSTVAESVKPTEEQQEAAMQLLGQEETDDATAQEPVSAQEETSGAMYRSTDSEEMLPDPAQQRGLRSPSLPKLLPMDMNGKLTPGL